MLNRTFVLHQSLSFTTSALLSLSASAGVITVDDDGPADFDDLPQAVSAAAPGDTLLVEPGSYTGFVLSSKPLAILGQSSGQVFVVGTTRVAGIGVGAEVVLADLDFETLELSDSSGVIVLDGVRIFASRVQRLVAVACADVRALGLHVDAIGQMDSDEGGGYSAVSVAGPGRFEVVDGFLEGRKGEDDYFGENVFVAHTSASVHYAGTSAVGGDGGYNSLSCHITFGCPCIGTGGVALRGYGAGTRLRVTGLPTDLLTSGKTSNPCQGSQCVISITSYMAGVPDAELSYSGAKLLPMVSGKPKLCWDSFPPMAVQVAPPEPLLELLVQAGPTQPPKFRVHGRTGDVVTLLLGRSAVVVPIPGVEVEQLTSEEAAIVVGVIPPEQTFLDHGLFKVPVAGVPAGTTYFAQASVLRGGAEWRTNSVPVVWR